jgi:hypothetical protein
MANYAQSQPYSFFGYPQSYTGGQSGYTGGYDATAYTPAAAPATRYEEIMAQPAAPMGGGGQSEEQRAEREAAYNAPQDYLSISRYDPEATARVTKIENAEPGDRYAPARETVKDSMSAAQLAALSPAERAMHMADVRRINPYRTLLSDVVTEFGVFPAVNSIYENFRYGNLGKRLAPGAPKAPVRDVLPGEYNFVNGGFISTPDTQAVQNAINNTDFSGMDRGSISAAPSTPDTQAVQNAINSTDFSGMDRGGGGGRSSDGGGGAATGGRDTGGGARDASGGGDRGTRGGFAQGGYVSMQNLGGLDPMGPDDGYAALKDGEYVINDKAVKKYGIELMNAINSGKISKGKLRGLLEM